MRHKTHSSHRWTHPAQSVLLALAVAMLVLLVVLAVVALLGEA